MTSTITVASFEDRLAMTEALLQGHFLLSSGRHSDTYFQCARLLQHPEHAAWACRELARQVTASVDVVAGPALGGILVAYEMARALGVRTVFTERVDAAMRLRRGFDLCPGERVLVVEDVVTTGLSARECAAEIRRAGGEVVAYASLVDRSGGTAPFDAPYAALSAMPVASFAADACPLCRDGQPIVKPGSRTLPQPQGA